MRGTVAEEIRGVTWDLWGEELTHEQTIQRILVGGFPIQGGVALTMFCIVEGESGEYQRAWHINVKRDSDGNIFRVTIDGKECMIPLSIDLGFIQYNVPIEAGTYLEMTPDAVEAFVESKFDEHPELADPFQSAVLAYELYKRRGFSPWYAYKPGTLKWRRTKKYGAKAFANWLVHSFVGKDPDTGKRLEMDYV